MFISINDIFKKGVFDSGALMEYKFGGGEGVDWSKVKSVYFEGAFLNKVSIIESVLDQYLLKLLKEFALKVERFGVPNVFVVGLETRDCSTVLRKGTYVEGSRTVFVDNGSSFETKRGGTCTVNSGNLVSKLTGQGSSDNVEYFYNKDNLLTYIKRDGWGDVHYSYKDNKLVGGVFKGFIEKYSYSYKGDLLAAVHINTRYNTSGSYKSTTSGTFVEDCDNLLEVLYEYGSCNRLVKITRQGYSVPHPVGSLNIPNTGAGEFVYSSEGKLTNIVCGGLERYKFVQDEDILKVVYL